MIEAFSTKDNRRQIFKLYCDECHRQFKGHGDKAKRNIEQYNGHLKSLKNRANDLNWHIGEKHLCLNCYPSIMTLTKSQKGRFARLELKNPNDV